MARLDVMGSTVRVLRIIVCAQFKNRLQHWQLNPAIEWDIHQLKI